MPQKLEITTKSILFTVALIFGGWLLLYMRDIIFLLFISFIIMSALVPIVEVLVKNKIPKILSIGLVYFVLIGLIALFSSFIFPPLVLESVGFFNNLPNYLNQLTTFFNIDFNTALGQIIPLGENIAKVTLGVFSNVLSIIALLILSFYFLLERHKFEDYLVAFVGRKFGKSMHNIISASEKRMGAWVRSQLFLMVIIGQVVYIGLLLLGVPFALPLAILAGVLEIVPIIGPNIAGFVGVIVALTISPGLALVVALFYFLTQQVENSLLLPLVMKKTVGIPPIVSLVALMVGGRLAGVMGAILAVPTLLVAQAVVREFTRAKT